MPGWPPIDRDDLKEASKRAGFDMEFPLLVRRLIAETADGLTELDMPGGSGVAAGGFDGVVTATEGALEVPAGRSVWELSTTNQVKKKLDEDYGKRLEGPDSSPASDCTYVQVILAPWRKSREWAAERRAEGRWKGVRALNLDDVHSWLDRAPATTAWLAERLNKAMPGVRAVDAWWSDTWLLSTEPPLGPEVVLAGREAVSQQLVARLLAGNSVITLEGELGPDGLRAFIGAALAIAEGPSGDRLRARTVHVTDLHSLLQLVRQPSPLVIVLDDPRLAAELPARHPHQLIQVAPASEEGSLLVPPVDAQQVEAALRAAGVSSDRSSDLGRLARRSLPALRRALALNAASLTPAWAAAPDLIQRRLALIGAWHGDSDADRSAVSRCVGRPYDQVQETALTLRRGDLPMLGRVDESWHLTSPQDTWLLLRRHVTRDDLEAFSTLAVEVLLHAAPAASTDDTTPSGAGLGWTDGYSRALRRGIAHTLALLATPVANDLGGQSGPDHARRVARKVFSAANADPTYATWASLTAVLSLLAEAAPDEFLRALRAGLGGVDPLHAKMFGDGAQGRPWAASSPHSAFLWALETVAWAPEYFDDAVGVLARLAALDPGGELANRPARSLVEILSLWAPETSASETQRHQALRRVLRDEPAVGRQLLLDLIPDGSEFQLAHQAPESRRWKKDQQPTTRDDLRRRIVDVVDLLLSDLDEDPGRYLAVIGKVDDLPLAQRAEFAMRLTALADRLDDDDDRRRLHDALREKIARHREYADTAWALPDSELAALEAATKALRPRDPARRQAWLFTPDPVELGDVSLRDDYVAYDAEVSRRRADAVRDVADAEGLDGVLRLAELSGSPRIVGTSLAAARPVYDTEVTAWLADADEPSQITRFEVAYGYVWARLRSGDPTAAEGLLTEAGAPAAQAAVLRAFREPVDAWQHLAGMPTEVAELYWRHFSYYGLGSHFARGLEVARGLLGVGRSAAALRVILMYSKGHDTEEAAHLVADALESLLASPVDDRDAGGLRSHEYERLFALLGRHRAAVGQARVLSLEWQLFPVLGHRANAPTLHAALSEQPEFFAQVVGYLYKPEPGSGGGHDEPPTDPDQRREFASRAFTLLQSWHRCPTAGPDGRVDPDSLRDWVKQARAALAQSGRLGPGDGEIGQSLAWAAPDEDGAYPPPAVRDLLEEVRSDRLDRGLEIGIHNKRGVTTRGIFEGGGAERRLAAGYREAADASTAWPRTAQLLRRLADSLDRDADEIESEAEGWRRGVDT